MSKGSRQRPVDKGRFDKEFDRIFKRDKKPEKPKQKTSK